ncbi:ShlB/FhaC/HecB family hemolysin secretion/activation protein [Aliamphritea hakodatensis]|uniref:ShlB/FhaC/HecB family hemolysin secretion/activation protein n=1 Tax=Aliamphritea hakodatensis TaxID=2895352 RepID=UPI0022FDAE35|nr:ShlB/FhaC/HecB family hemolysin secretion/activation protein [Aliamphritea hakodatensis]
MDLPQSGQAALFCSVLIFAFQALAAPEPSVIAEDQLQRAEQQQEALQRQLQPSSDSIHLSVPQADLPQSISDEQCFPIEDVVLKGDESLTDRSAITAILARHNTDCLGPQAIKSLMNKLQNHYIEQGLVTTRVVAPPQDLNAGTLTLQIVAGKAGNIGRDPSAPEGDINLNTVVPLNKGDYLDIRALEQALENLHRLSAATASFSLHPTEDVGVSDIRVKWQQEKMWRLILSANDSGADNTGKYQGNATLFIENPLQLSDVFYISKGRDLHTDSDTGSDNYSVHYSLPIGYWQFDLNSSRNDYEQSVAGLNGNVAYTGQSTRHSVDVTRVIRRTGTAKTSIRLGLTRRASRNFVNGTEVGVQRRDTSYAQLSLIHRQQIPVASQQLQLDTRISFRKGNRWFGAQPAPEETTGDATALSDILLFSLYTNLPFQWGEQPLRWGSSFQAQWTDSKLTSQDRFTIGNRYTVRGFDGAVTLSADRGWFLQNELAMRLGETPAEAFVSLDMGEVSGRGSDELLGTRLAGASVGVKGSHKAFSYQFFIGTPLYKPEGFQARETSVGFTLNWEF